MKRDWYLTTGLYAALAVVLGLLAPGAPLAAQAKKLLNVDKDGVAVHGYDSVAYFLEGKAVRGDRQFQSNYAGATYYFQSAADKETFDKEPGKYSPQYGGHCAMAMTMGKLEDVDPNYFLVHDGKLLLQRNVKAHMMFAKDPTANHKKADENWEKLQLQQGK